MDNLTNSIIEIGKLKTITHGNVHFMSKSVEWETPQHLFDKYNNIFNFGLDVCATPKNAKCDKYFTEQEDGLMQDWNNHGNVWCNPPYGRGIGKWLKKAYECNSLVVMLVPARTCSAWWHDYATKGIVILLRGRLKFGGHTNSAPFPSAIVIFGMPK